MKKNKRDFFNFIFVFPSDSCQYSIGVHYVFSFCLSTAARLIRFPPVTAPGEILPFQLVKKKKKKNIHTIFQLNSKRRKHENLFPSILIQLENGANEFYFYFFISSSEPNLLRKESVKQKLKKTLA